MNKRWIFLTIMVIGVATAVFFSPAININVNPPELPTFNSIEVKSKFYSYYTQLYGTQHFQFAKLDQVEHFERKSAASLFDGRVKLPDVIVSATVPVEYTYYLDLEKKWNFMFNEGVLTIIVPKIEFNRPAMDYSNLKFNKDKKSWMRNEDHEIDLLKLELQKLIEVKAEENKKLILEIGRKQVSSFFSNWFKLAYKDHEFDDINVIFSEEVPIDPQRLN